MPKEKKVKKLILLPISLLIVLILVVSYLVLTNARGTNNTIGSNNGSSETTPSAVAIKPSGTIVTRPVPTGIYPSLATFETIEGKPFVSYGTFFDYYSQPYSELTSAVNRTISFKGSDKILKAPVDWKKCTQDLYDLNFYYPGNGDCKLFAQTYSNHIGEFSILGIVESNSPDYLVYVSIFESKSSIKDLFPLNTGGGFGSLRSLRIGGRPAIQYVTAGAEGSLFEYVDIKLDEHTVMSIWFNIKEFSGEPELKLDTKKFNDFLYNFSNTIQ